MTQPSAPSETAGSVSIRADELAAMVQGQLIGNPDIILRTLAPIEDGGPGTLTFIRSSSFAKHWESSACQAALVSEGIDVPGHDPQNRALILVKDADLAVVRILEAINPGTALPVPGIDKNASVSDSSSIDPTARIGPGCVIADDAVVAPGVAMLANCYIGAGAKIGPETVLHPGVVIGDRCVLGHRCLVFANAVIGADGFGYIPASDDHHAVKIPQIGSVEIGDDVEIGACTSIDRAKFGVTRVGNRTKIDNQVHIGHNCVIGDDVLLCGRTTLGGSSTIGDRTMIGGAVVLNDQARVGCDVRIAGGAMVLDAIEDGQTVLGIPAMPSRTAMANLIAQRNLAKFTRRVEKSLKKLDPGYEPAKDSQS